MDSASQSCVPQYLLCTPPVARYKRASKIHNSDVSRLKMSSAQCRRGAKSVITHVIIHFGFIFSNRRIRPPILPNHPNPLPGPPDPPTFILLMSIILILHTRLKSAPGSGQTPDFIHTNRHIRIAQLPKKKYGKPPKGNPLKMTFEKIVRPLPRPT